MHELTAGTTIVPWTNRRPAARPTDPGWTEGPDRSGVCLALSSPGSAQPGPRHGRSICPHPSLQASALFSENSTTCSLS